MGSKLTDKMVISFALLILVFTMGSFAVDNNTNNNISQSQFNVESIIPVNESQISTNNISVNPEPISWDIFKGLDISSILSNGANLLTILVILTGFFLWLIRNKIIRIFKPKCILEKKRGRNR
ncbi:MAG: hypothetical protein NTU95_02785 [Methanothrix sp.]|nr:hypothetical protein [Methanothrix sp.]